MREIRIQLGTVIDITDTEEKLIFGDDTSQMEKAIRKIIAEDRFCLDGEACVPSEAVQEFNRRYGTAHDEEDWYCDL